MNAGNRFAMRQSGKTRVYRLALQQTRAAFWLLVLPCLSRGPGE
jgi:hypothetical protein